MTAFCTLAQVKTYLGPPASTSSASDAELNQLINSVAYAMILEAHLPMREDGETPTFFEDTYTERYHGTGGSTLALRWTPVTKVSSVTIDGTDIPLSDDPTVWGFVADRFAVHVRGYKFFRGIKNVTVKYTAGLDPNGDMAASLALMAVELVAMVYKGKKYLAVSSEKLGDQMISYARQAMPERTTAFLDSLRPKMAVGYGY